jgi:acetyl esterase/lipase
MLKQLTITCALIAAVASAFSQQTPIKLYPNGVPNSKKAPQSYVEKDDAQHAAMVTDPTLTPYFPEKGKANGTAIIICPGGGYARLSMANEGSAVAQQCIANGVTAFVLKYRLPSDEIMTDKAIGPLQDAERAIQMVRQHAVEWGINPNKVGIMGFSAGGHLASTLGTHFDKVLIENKQNISLRPDFMVLLYPVITFGELAHGGSRTNLIGLNAPQQLVDYYSNEKQVTANTPITFIVQAQDDKTVPVQNSLMFYEALLKNKVMAEMHLYPQGGHGFGLNNKTTKDQWFDRLVNWMDANKLLTK